ncbi:uncharacterized protein LOC129611031 [Condylostylus longicornis]|uniref:uncharacterized protein LOC129611031 n=1 Tax=Condylostylus longicornis TaxID=2530218 RepID=UPI00244D9FB1|nr:uncharacterized protein LOC129611031 [Condylostylus longicornis]
MNLDYILENIIDNIGHYFGHTLQELNTVNLGIQFSEFQFVLLKIISFLLLIICVLNLVFWRRYGEVITEKFIKQSTLKEIEELKLSVAKLKLPKEHSPRI